MVKKTARRITLRMYYNLPNNGSYSGINNVESRWEEAKRCAVVAVEEILDETTSIQVLYKIEDSYIDFWNKVKKEIENL